MSKLAEAVAKASDLAEQIEQAGGRHPIQFDVTYAYAIKAIIAERAAVEAAEASADK